MGDGRQPWLHDLITVLSAPTMVLSERSGQVRRCGAQGALQAGSRILCQAVLEIAGAEPTPVSSGLVSAQTAFFAAIPRQLAGPGPDPAVWVTRQRTARPGAVQERVHVRAGGSTDVVVPVVLRLAADLAMLTEIKVGQARPLVRMTVTSSGLEWGDDRLRVRLTAPGAVVTADAHGAASVRWQVRLDRGADYEFGWQLTVQDATAVVLPPRVASAAIRPGPVPLRTGRTGPARGRRLDTTTAVPAQRSAGADGDGDPGDRWARVRAEPAGSRLSRLLSRSLADAAALRMVTSRAPGEVFLGAGAPWYLTLFGRDSIWAARLLLPFGWDLARGTLRALAAYQGSRVDPGTGEAPGKIPHELRPTSREPAPAGALPPLYYGTIDATPLWVCLLHDAWRWGLPAADVRALLPAMRAALTWMRDYGDADGDGLLEYRGDNRTGLANQGWKDSRDAIRFADGQLATGPVTLCEVQGYAHQAALTGADLLDAFDQPGAQQWRAWAARLAAAFRSSFWVAADGGPYPALALDGRKRRVDALTSNIGHLLGTGLLTAAEEAQVALRLSQPDLNSGFGLRTMSARSGGYSPLSYHCGSVWSHDTAIAIAGLVRAGHLGAAASLADGLLEAASAFDWRLPELFSGQARGEVPWPSPYPASCRPQAWAAAAAGALIQAILGLDVNVPAGVVRIEPPRLGGMGPLHVAGLIAGQDEFGAGVGDDGRGYVRGLSLSLVPR